MQIHENVARIFYIIGRFAHAYFVVIQQNRRENERQLLYVKHQAKFLIKQPKSHLWRAPRREHYIVFIRYNITTRAHIAGIIICSKKLYTL